MTAEQRNRLYYLIDTYGTYASRISAIIMLMTTLWFVFIFADDYLEEQTATLARYEELQKEQAERLSKLEQDFEMLNTTLSVLQQDGSRQEQHLSQLAQSVDLATRPNLVFEVNLAQSGPRNESCIEYEPCIMDIRARRTMEGLNCQLIDGSDRYYFVEAETGSRIEVTKTAGTPTANIGREWFDYHWQFEMPADLSDPIGFMYQFTYNKCRGVNDMAEVTQESPLIPVAVTRMGAPIGAPDLGGPNE